MRVRRPEFLHDAAQSRADGAAQVSQVHRDRRQPVGAIDHAAECEARLRQEARQP
jgi:hypothetical protein